MKRKALIFSFLLISAGLYSNIYFSPASIGFTSFYAPDPDKLSFDVSGTVGELYIHCEELFLIKSSAIGLSSYSGVTILPTELTVNLFGSFDTLIGPYGKVSYEYDSTDFYWEAGGTVMGFDSLGEVPLHLALYLGYNSRQEVVLSGYITLYPIIGVLILAGSF